MNASGKGGFGDNPQNRSDGGWSKDTSHSYWYNYIIRLSLEDFKKFKAPSVAAQHAYNAALRAFDELPDLKEVTDRTEGKAIAKTEITGAEGTSLITTVNIIKK